MQMKTRLWTISGAMGLVVLAACTPETATGSLATLALTPCRVAHVDTEVKCATLPVFENRATGAGRKIGLNIVVLPALARNKEPDPIFIFAGGPGQAAGGLAREVLAMLGGLNSKRDLVLIDQRGTGKSNGLHCTFPDATSVEMQDPATRDAASREATIACRDKLAAKADLSLYTTTIAIADIDEVRAALGYAEINLWGGSYGTRAAMEYLRRYENRVRSVVLDGVAPPSLALPASFAGDAGQVLEKMFAACKKEAPCEKQYADVKTHLDDFLAALEKSPRKARVADPMSGVVREIKVSREMLLGAIFPALYVPEMVALLPASLAAAKQGDYAGLMAMSALFNDSAEEKMSRGMQLSVVCTEDLPRVNRAGKHPPPFAGVFVDEFAKACESWPTGTMPADFTQAVKSAKPVLILSGALDPVTPPAYGEEVKKNFTNAAHAIAPNIGHGVSARGCAPKLIKKFVETASIADLDLRCLERLPRPTFFRPLQERAKVTSPTLKDTK